MPFGVSFKGRSTGEILVLIVAFTVCGYVVLSGAFLAFVYVFRPNSNLAQAARNIADVINTMIGLLAGFLAGRTDAFENLGTRHNPDEAMETGSVVDETGAEEG